MGGSGPILGKLKHDGVTKMKQLTKIDRMRLIINLWGLIAKTEK